MSAREWVPPPTQINQSLSRRPAEALEETLLTAQQDLRPKRSRPVFSGLPAWCLPFRVQRVRLCRASVAELAIWGAPLPPEWLRNRPAYHQGRPRAMTATRLRPVVSLGSYPQAAPVPSRRLQVRASRIGRAA